MTRSKMFSIACALCAMLPAVSVAQLGGPAVRVDAVAEKLGVKGLPNGARELEPGQSATMMLLYSQETIEIFASFRPTLNRKEIDDLNQQSCFTFARLTHNIDQLTQAGNKAIITNS